MPGMIQHYQLLHDSVRASATPRHCAGCSKPIAAWEQHVKEDYRGEHAVAHRRWHVGCWDEFCLGRAVAVGQPQTI